MAHILYLLDTACQGIAYAFEVNSTHERHATDSRLIPTHPLMRGDKPGIGLTGAPNPHAFRRTFPKRASALPTRS